MLKLEICVMHFRQKTTCLRLAFIQLLALLFFSCAIPIIRISSEIENYDIIITRKGIQAADYSSFTKSEWWELFYQHLAKTEADNTILYPQFQRDPQFDAFLHLLEHIGQEGFDDRLGEFKYFELGDNSGPVADISYFRILNEKKDPSYRRLYLLIQKGVEIKSNNFPKEVKESTTFSHLKEKEGIFWILYRFSISRMIDTKEKSYNLPFYLSCDKHFCVTDTNGIRRVFHSKAKAHYRDFITPECKGYDTIKNLFNRAINQYILYYKKT